MVYSSHSALALPDRTFNSSSCLPSLVNVTPRYLYFSTRFHDTPTSCREHWTGFLERCKTSVLEVPIFVPAISHATASHLMLVGGQIPRKPAKLNHLQKAVSRLILHLPIVILSSVRLSLSIQFM